MASRRVDPNLEAVLKAQLKAEKVRRRRDVWMSLAQASIANPILQAGVLVGAGAAAKVAGKGLVGLGHALPTHAGYGHTAAFRNALVSWGIDAGEVLDLTGDMLWGGAGAEAATGVIAQLAQAFRQGASGISVAYDVPQGDQRYASPIMGGGGSPLGYSLPARASRA